MTQFTVLLDMQPQLLHARRGLGRGRARAGRAARAGRGDAGFGPKVAAWYGRLLARRGREEQAELVARLVWEPGGRRAGSASW